MLAPQGEGFPSPLLLGCRDGVLQRCARGRRAEVRTEVVQNGRDARRVVRAVQTKRRIDVLLAALTNFLGKLSMPRFVVPSREVQ